MNEQRAARCLDVIHLGSFSGITPALVAGLQTNGATVNTHEMSFLARTPSALPARLAAQLMSLPRGRPWARSSTWARQIARHVNSLPPAPLLFMQTVLACDVEPGRPYSVFTDRVTAEGHQSAGAWRSSTSQSWLDLEWRFLRNAQHIFVMGPSTEEFLVAHGLPPERITVTGSGVNAAIPPLRDRTSDTPDRLLFLGKEWERKGGPGLVEALRQVRLQTSHRPLLDIVGCSPTVTDDFCNVMGAIPPAELAPILDRASALTMPTRSEAFGVAYVEALSAGLPVVGSNASNVPWIVGDAGLCPDPEDTHDIFRSLVELMDDYGAYAKAAFVRGATFRKEWTWARIAAAVLVHVAK